MRDPARISKMLDEIASVWAKMPDQRLCQLIWQICSLGGRPIEKMTTKVGWCERCGLGYESNERPMFSFDDDEFMQLLRKFAE